jgi:hypothetical protein
MKALYPPERQYKIWHGFRGPFLFPRNFGGHKCEWEPFSYTQAGCLLCGREHRCAQDNADCLQVKDDDGHISCAITGAVVRTSDLQAEWGAPSRTYVETRAPRNGGTGKSQKKLSTCDIWTFVNQIVCSILDSETTEKCRFIENKRISQAFLSTFHKEIRKVWPCPAPRSCFAAKRAVHMQEGGGAGHRKRSQAAL